MPTEKLSLPKSQMDFATGKEYYEGKAAAEVVGVDYRTIVNMVKDGRLSGFSRTGAYGVCVWRSSLERFLKSRDIQPIA